MTVAVAAEDVRQASALRDGQASAGGRPAVARARRPTSGAGSPPTRRTHPRPAGPRAPGGSTRTRRVHVTSGDMRRGSYTVCAHAGASSRRRLVDRRAFLSLPAAAVADVAGPRRPARLPRAGASHRPLSRPGGAIARSALRQVSRQAMPRSSGSTRAVDGPRARSGSATCGCLLWSDIPNDRHHALDRRDRRRQRVPAAGQQQQRQHARPAGRLVTCEHGTAASTRTEHDGTHHRAGRARRRQAAQRAQRRRRASRRRRLVHRPRLRHPGRLRGRKGETLELPTRVYRIDPTTGALDARDRRASAKPNGLCFSPDYTKLVRRRHRRPAPSATGIHVFDVVGRRRLGNGRVFHDGFGARAAPTASAATPTATSGPARAGPATATTACTCSRPTARTSARSTCPRSAATCASAAPSATACS